MDPRETQEHDSVFTVPHLGPRPGGGDTTRRDPPGFVLPLPTGPASAPPAGEQRIGNYRLLREVGRGGMGVVHLAEHVGLRRQVALEVLAAAGDPELVERFQVEARAAARLNHPNVVGVQYRLLADLHGRSGDLTAAVDVLSRGLEACPGDVDLLRMRVSGLLAQNAFTTAIADCDRVLAVAPDAETLAMRADIRRLQGDHGAAVADASAALVLRPGLPAALLVRGLSREHLGQRDGALADLEAWLRATPNEHPLAARVRQSLARLRAP